MKKVFVMLFAVVIAASAWTKPSPSPAENEKVMAAFQEQFGEAKDVNWTEKEGFYLASFKLNNDRMLVWYTAEGVVEAVQRTIQTNQLTFLAAEAVDKLMLNKALLNLVEISKQGELFYIAKIEDEKCISVYKVSASGDYTRIDKTKKKK
jgi:hypothetical protein